MTDATRRAIVAAAETPKAGPGGLRMTLNHVCGLLGEEFQRVLLDTLAEAARGELAHGRLPLDSHRRLAILTEEVLELTQATNDHSWVSPRAAQVRAEAVQVAAVALRMVVTHDLFTIDSAPR